MGETITTRIDDRDAAEIRAIGKEERLDRSAVVRRLLGKALLDRKIERALQQYKEGKITIGKVAELTGLGLRDALALASAKGIPFQYTIRELREDLKEALR